MASYTSKVIAVLGRTVRAGRWKLAEDSLVIAVFGRCAIDLSRSYVDDDDDELSMSIFALFGSVTVLLPPGCDVEPSGVAIISSSQVEIPSEPPADITRSALAPLDLSFFALFSKVKVAEVVGADAGPGLGSAAGVAGLALGATMAPPAIEVFDAETEIVEKKAVPVEAAAAATATTFDDPDAQAAVLRDEIAQWRAESGKTAPSEADADAESGDEAAATGATADVAAG